jgi:hypothetical protein
MSSYLKTGKFPWMIGPISFIVPWFPRHSGCWDANLLLWEIRNRVSVRLQACFNGCTSTMQFSPLGHENWHARASQAAPLFEIISSQIDTLRKSQCVSKCLRKSQSMTGSLRSSQTIQSCIFGRTTWIVNNENRTCAKYPCSHHATINKRTKILRWTATIWMKNDLTAIVILWKGLSWLSSTLGACKNIIRRPSTSGLQKN